ncbi:ion channel [Cycloclasticus pugetii]|uniref:ion channel n=1 Tax=Cycloclasticus pugetii TaxID=34068 RepID=UPI00038128AE|nr:ion channel [Cycloclasticus pugetii]
MTGLPKINKKITKKVDILDIAKDSKIELHYIVFKKEVEGPKQRIYKVCFDRCLFSAKEIKDIIFLDCTFSECQFNGARIINCEFHQCKFKECVFYKAEIEGTYIDPSSFAYKSEWHKKWANVNAWWFQALFQNSKKMHQEGFAMIADKRFQFYRRYDYLFGKKKHPFKYLSGLIYDIALGYGYGIWNVIVVTSALISLFAFLMVSQTSMNANAGLLESIYFSVVSFTTVGYGEITPAKNTPALIITTAFLFLSVIWGSIVTAVIVKRLVK